MERRETVQTDPTQPDGIIARVVAPFSDASDIRNLVRTPYGLRSITGPTPLVPKVGSELYDTNHGTPGGVGFFRDKYGKPHVLVHIEDAIKVWVPSSKTYATLIGSGGVVTDTISRGDANQPPTLFTVTGRGIVITPWLGRSYFYDGEIIAPLGYERPPGAPTLSGPEKETRSDYGAWASGYNKYSSNVGVMDIWGACQLGTSREDPGSAYVIMPPASWKGAVQFVDVWGNLSPMSAAAALKVPAAKLDTTTNSPEDFTYQILWRDIEGGSGATVGTVLLRTQDTLSSGDAGFYEVPLGRGGGVFALGSMGGTTCSFFPDNVPDKSLVLPATQVTAMPRFRYSAYGDERLWIGNAPDYPNRVWHSLPNRPGTIPGDAAPFDFPAPVMGLCATSIGILVLTERSAHLISRDDRGEYVTRQVSDRVGCTAPATVQAFRGGAVWLFGDAFYALLAQTDSAPGVQPISMPIQQELRALNQGRVRRASAYVDPVQDLYRAFVPLASEQLGTMIEFDGEGWRRHDYAYDVHGCCWADKYGVFSGKVSDVDNDRLGAVWCVERETAHFVPPARTHRVDSAWLRFGEVARGTPLVVYAMLRETTDDASITLNVYRDGRMNEVVSTSTVKVYREESAPPAFDDGLLGAGLYWLRRRVFIARYNIMVSSAESIKLSFVGTANMELVSFSVGISPRAEQGRTAR